MPAARPAADRRPDDAPRVPTDDRVGEEFVLAGELPVVVGADALDALEIQRVLHHVLHQPAEGEQTGDRQGRHHRSEVRLEQLPAGRTKPNPISAAESMVRNTVARPTDSAIVAPREVCSTKCSVVRAVSSACSRACSSIPPPFVPVTATIRSSGAPAWPNGRDDQPAGPGRRDRHRRVGGEWVRSRPPRRGHPQQLRAAGGRFNVSDTAEQQSPATVGGRELRADCTRCFGICCVAPAFSASADFALDKPAGQPCPNLGADSRCGIHRDLRQRGFPGCTVFDCFGAGQQVAQVTFGGRDWRAGPGDRAPDVRHLRGDAAAARTALVPDRGARPDPARSAARRPTPGAGGAGRLTDGSPGGAARPRRRRSPGAGQRAALPGRRAGPGRPAGRGPPRGRC